MTTLNRRQLAAGAAALCLAGVSPAQAQGAYPQRPVKLIVPYAPGGGTDVFSRLLAAQMEKEFGQPLVIDNRAGGASTIGTRAVADAPGDGYTIGMVDSAFVTNPGLLGEKLPYDTRKDFIPVSLLSRTQLVLAVPEASRFKTAKELVDYAKANPGKLTFASAGIGTGIHLAGEQFRQVAGIQIVIVPYRGGAPALADFLAGKVDFTFGAVPSIKSYIEAGKARGLGVTRGRAPQLPGIRFNARADRREAAAHFGLDRERPSVSREASRARLSADRQFDRRIPQPCRPRDRQMGEDHRGRQHQAGMTAAWVLIAKKQPFTRAGPLCPKCLTCPGTRPQ
jgi:tripartite-type tricarboxylate transporter receptor subunit TctC